MSPDDLSHEILRTQLRALVAEPAEPAETVLVRLRPTLQRARLVHRVIVSTAVAAGAVISIGTAVMWMPGPSSESTHQLDVSTTPGVELGHEQQDALPDLSGPHTTIHIDEGTDDDADHEAEDEVAIGEVTTTTSPSSNPDPSHPSPIDDDHRPTPQPGVPPTVTEPPAPTTVPGTLPTTTTTTTPPTTTTTPAPGAGTCAAGPQRYDIPGGSVIVACDDTKIWIVELLPDADYEAQVEHGSPKKLKVRFHSKPEDHKVDHEIELELKNGKIVVNGHEVR